jgi:hypothetical protein
MSISGTYGFVYSGAVGLGLGALYVESDGRVIGHDWGGVRYEGEATVLPNARIRLRLKQSVPSGIRLVEGTSAQELPFAREITHEFPPEFGGGKPETVTTPLGTVYVMVQRVTDDYAGAAQRGFVIQILSAAD